MNQSHRILLGSLLAAPSLLLAQAPDDAAQPQAATKAAVAAGAPGAEPTAPTASGSQFAPGLVPVHTAADDLGLAYGVWAAGTDYKVSFHDGMTFVPYLGVDYPMTQSLHWQTKSARIGEVDLLGASQSDRVTTPWRCEYHFAGVVEAYDVRAEGLEQTFVVDQLPAAGDLVIRGAVTSALRADQAAPRHQSLTFVDAEGRSLVQYGNAFVFDAAGRRAEITTGYADGEVTLTVPGSWLANATLPVTVDPMLTRVQLISWGAATFGQVEAIDIARDDVATTSNVMVVYSRAASATDNDLWIRLCNDDFSNVSLVFSDITTSWSTDQASCAFVGGTTKWVTAFRRFFPTLTPTLSQLRAHVRASGDTSLLTGYSSLVPPTNGNDWRPDVGGVEGFSTGNNALIVFQREDNAGGNFANTNLSEVDAVLLDTTSTNGTFGSPFTIKPSTIHDNERPSVNQVAEGGASFSWVCVYQRFIDGATNEDWDLNGARINQSGGIATGTWISDLATVTPSLHQLGPVVEGQDGRYAVTFTTLDVATYNFKTGLIAGETVQVERFDWANAAANPSNDQAPVTLRSNNDRRWEATGCAFDTNDDSHWTVGYRAIAPGVPVAYYDRVGYTGNRTETGILYYVVGENPTGVVTVFNNDANTSQCAYSVDEGGVNQWVYGHVVTYDTPAAISSYGVACGFANVSWSGARQIGAEFGSINVSGSPAGALHLMVLANAGIDVPLVIPGLVGIGCNLYVPISGPNYYGMFPTAVGSSASWPLPLPEALANQVLSFQDWYLDPTTLLLYGSTRLDVPIIK